uniref:Uncharacterized protein n=1 Tax=Panagrolaimus sp. ES5 TaxID=591445 RepID=A0AC34GSM2_9BILA
MGSKVAFSLAILLCLFSSSYNLTFVIDDRDLKPGDKGKFAIYPLNETMAFISFYVEQDRALLTLFLCLIESVSSWYFGLIKDEMNSVPRNYYVVSMIVVSQSAGAFFSYLAMDGRYNFKTLLAGINVTLFVSNALYFTVSKLVKHEIVFKKNYKTIGFLVFNLAVLFFKVFIYKISPKKPTFGDCAKLLGLAFCPIVSLVIPLIVSKNSDAILRRVSDNWPKLTNVVLFISGYKKVEFKAECLSAHQNKGFNMEKLSFEMFNNKIEKIRLNDEVEIELRITLENEEATEKCEKFFNMIFQQTLPTVSSVDCFF